MTDLSSALVEQIRRSNLEDLWLYAISLGMFVVLPIVGALCLTVYKVVELLVGCP